MLSLLLSLLLPSHATCPRGSYLDHGVTPAGVYRCARFDGDVVARGVVFCARGVPVVELDGVSVRCRVIASN